mmetsp:Transcript_10356/g.10384  ORF Transcript_10356/g.10384 Transcript_10356/m.10384 type:complete len:93 (-) Transcript_10356:1515-1793(-)
MYFNEFKDSYKQLDEAYKIFKSLNTNHGMALCCCAQGYILQTKTAYFQDKNTDEHQIFVKAGKKFQEAIEHYQKIQHAWGEAYCHKLLGQIK